MKRFLIVLVTVLGTLCIVGACASASKTRGAFVAGTYTATEQGMAGNITVEVVFSSTKIESVRVLQHNETPGIGDIAVDQLPGRIVEHQSLAIDGIAGATISSTAILRAVEDCAGQAGADLAALKTKTVAAVQTGDRTAYTDILVIGGGGTGLSAAISAYQSGARRIIVVEKQGVWGGSTALSGGMQGATETRFKKASGVQDTAADWLAEWKRSQEADLNLLGIACNYPNYSRLTDFMKAATITADWLEDYIGVQYVPCPVDFGTFTLRVHVLADFIQNGQLLSDGGYLLTNKLRDFLLARGVDMRLETKGVKLLTNNQGDVTGAVVQDSRGQYTIYAEKAVLLGTGGFAYDEAFLKEHLPYFAGIMDVSDSAKGNTGDGIRMAVEVGAELYDDPYVIGFGAGTRKIHLREFVTPFGLPYLVVVDGDGKRFVNEAAAYSAITIAISLSKPQTWGIADNQGSPYLDYVRSNLDSDQIVSADTIEELAVKMNIDAASIVNTIRQYNVYCAARDDKDFHKRDRSLDPIDTPPYYAVKLFASNAGTIGGVRTNENMQVLRANGSLIKGLYAGGETSNRELYAYTYMSGSGVSHALTSGRIMGSHAALNN
jgi:fumarate reductase flavoprotein subunit